MTKLMRRAGEKGTAGHYWAFDTGEHVKLNAGAVLPGAPGRVYYKVHPALLVLLGPMAGLVFAIFLPFIGIAMLLTLGLRRLGARLPEWDTRLAEMMRKTGR